MTGKIYLVDATYERGSANKPTHKKVNFQFRASKPCSETAPGDILWHLCNWNLWFWPLRRKDPASRRSPNWFIVSSEHEPSGYSMTFDLLWDVSNKGFSSSSLWLKSLTPAMPQLLWGLNAFANKEFGLKDNLGTLLAGMRPSTRQYCGRSYRSFSLLAIRQSLSTADIIFQHLTDT